MTLRIVAATAIALSMTTPVLAQDTTLGRATPARAGDPEQRAAALVARMTLEEKASQLVNTSPAIPRLGIPAYQWWNEALHGVIGDPYATNYPEPIGLAATFDAPLVNRMSAQIVDELHAIRTRKLAQGRVFDFAAGLDVWAPNVNIVRDPRWGRGQETYGEDPFLTGRLAVAYVTGFQGPADSPSGIATPKHFAVHSGPEPTRHRADVKVSLHDERDTYLPAFRAAVTEAKAGSVMCAYNSINGQPACANDFLLRQTLRGAWGFKGYVVSDCEAVADIWQGHKYAKDAAAASAEAIRHGVDNECTVAGFIDSLSFNRSQNYVDAVRRGDLPEAEVDSALIRLLAVRIRLGDLDRGPAASSPAASTSAYAPPATHGALAELAAEESMVLLKNDGVLPLGAHGRSQGKLRVAVIGPLADSRHVLRGNYTSRETAELPSIYDGLRRALPDADVTLVPAGASITDGDVVPPSVLQTENGAPGVTAQFYSVIADTLPPPRSFGEAFQQFAKRAIADTPVVTRVLPFVSLEGLGGQPILPRGGRVVASGYLVPKMTGTYRLGVEGGATTLSFAGQALASTSGRSGGLPAFGTVELQAGQRYPFSVTSTGPRGELGPLVWQRVSANPDSALAAAARDADVVVAVVGITSSLEGEEMRVDIPGFNGGDRTTFDLPADQAHLLEVAKAARKPIVVVDLSGSAMNLDWAKRNANAIVQAWYPGEAGGVALGRVLSGAVSPAGRLPETFYKSVSQLPPFEDYAMQGRTYRYFTGTPVYPFGFGLSYTRFAYAPVHVAASGQSTADGIEVRTSVRNVGARAGDEVAQLYLTFPDFAGVPRLALRGFQRVHLAPGERRELVFRLSPRDLSSVSPDGQVRVLAGKYRVYVGGGQPGSGLPTTSTRFAIGKTIELPE